MVLNAFVLFVSGVDYVRAVRCRRELRAELQFAMATLDLLRTAILPVEAAKTRRSGETGLVRETRFNVADYPAISCAPALAPAGCGRPSSSSAERLTSRLCSALPIPSERRPRSASNVRRSLAFETACHDSRRRTRATRLRDPHIGQALCRPRTATGGA
jgi:hypothetical protein